MERVLLTATVQSHIAQFHLPLINMLKENGYEVHVAARDNLAEKNGLKIVGADNIFNIPFERSPLNKKNILAYKQLKKIIAENKYDVIHCNTPIGGIITRLAAKKSRKNGTRVFYTAHGFHFYKGGSLKSWLVYYPIEKFFARYTDTLITITEEDFKLAKNRKFKTHVVRTHGVGVNNEKYKPISEERKIELREREGYREDEFLIICTGELNVNKNQEVIIRAVALLKEDIPNVCLLLAGNGANEEHLKKVVSEIGIDRFVRFLGYKTNLEDFVCMSDMVVSTSKREGLPMNIMEAMVAKKPIVASINRGHKELIENNTTGLLIPQTNSKEVANAILDIYYNKERRYSMGANALKEAQKYIIENIKTELIQIYDLNTGGRM